MSEGRKEREKEEREISKPVSRCGGGGRGVFSLAGRLTLRATYNYRVPWNSDDDTWADDVNEKRESKI